ncbi:MAG: hypothetical protein D6E12_12945 [Desulfovibrio sp.]|nr:MAG: hypothetical protein D6E12_12945 [Desulfovibrio sp.]
MTTLTCLMFLVLAVAASAQDARQELIDICASEGEPLACCECGVDVMFNELSEEEVGLILQMFGLMDQLEAAAQAEDQARIEELVAQAEALQGQFDEAKMTALDQSITSTCASVCPE